MSDRCRRYFKYVTYRRERKRGFWLYYPLSFVAGFLFPYSDFYEDWKTEESYPLQRQVGDGCSLV